MRLLSVLLVLVLQPVQEVERQSAANSTAALENGLVEIIKLDSTIRLDVRYATANNFMKRPMYTQARAFLQREAAEALVRAHIRLKRHGFGILLFDGYRPWDVTKKFWDETSPAQRNFLANPADGSKHNRGCAADVSLYDLRTGEEVSMPSAYDEFSKRASPAYRGGSVEQRRKRDLLRNAMEAEGFTVNPTEWWHFDYRSWRDFPILNIPFESLK